MGARVLAPEEMFPAGLPGYRVRQLQLRSGFAVRVVELGDTNAPPVLLMHGWACTVFDFRSTMPALAAGGFRAIAVDLLGHGLSDKPAEPALYETDAMTAHALEIMDALGIHRAALCGHSMGGGIALRVALQHPDRVSRLVLMNPSGFGTIVSIPPGRLLSPRIVTPWLRHFITWHAVALLLHVVYGPRRALTVDDIAEYYAPVELPGFVRAMRHSLHAYDFRRLRDSDISSLSVPALLLLGERDRVVMRLPFLGRPQLPANPRSRTMIIPRGGHVVQDEAPEEVNPAILEFLAHEREAVARPHNS